MQYKLVSHHVGARDGGIALPILPAFAPDIINVLYDADSDSIEQIREIWSRSLCETRVFAACLSGRNGECALSVNFDAYTSSILPFNEDFARYYMYFGPYGVDYVLGDACRSMETRKLQGVTLDELMKTAELTDAPPDFLSLDTQGTEIDILEGGRETLRRVLAVYCEAEFVPIYCGQRLFGDLVGMLTAEGFRLAHCHLHEGFSPMRAPIGARAEGYPFGSDLLFLRETAGVEREIADPVERHLALHKLAFISLLFNLLEHGLSVLDTALGIDIPAPIKARFSELRYYRFLMQLLEHVAALPQQRPPTIGEARSFEQMQTRFRLLPSV